MCIRDSSGTVALKVRAGGSEIPGIISCLKKVVRHVVKDYQKKLKRRQKEETLFCELPEIVVESLAVWDDYDTDYTIFNVCGSDNRICDDELAEALKHLSERNRENLLMYYFLEMSDKMCIRDRC